MERLFILSFFFFLFTRPKFHALCSKSRSLVLELLVAVFPVFKKGLSVYLISVSY